MMIEFADVRVTAHFYTTLSKEFLPRMFHSTDREVGDVDTDSGQEVEGQPIKTWKTV